MKKSLSLLAALLLFAAGALPAVSLAEQQPLRIVTSFYPLHIFAKNVLKDVQGVSLNNLTHPTTGCLHDYQLLATDMKVLAQTDMLIINGGGMEPFLDIVEEQFSAMQVVDTSAGVTLLPNMELGAGHDDEDHRHDEDAAHEGEEAHEEDHEEAAADHEHDHGEFNAHIWLDPRNAILMTRTMAAALAARLPDQAELIQSNTADYVARLEALDMELKQQLSGLARHDIVTFHEAFPYFAQAYGLHVVAVLALEPDEALTPQMLTELVTKVWEAGLPPLFTEPQYKDRAARAVAQETGAPIFELDPIVTGDGDPQAYEQGMRRNAQALLEALGQK